MNKQPYGALIIHGFASSLDSVGGIEAQLKLLGIPTCMPVLRGHEQSSPEALRGATWHDWMADAEAGLRALSSEVERVAVVGHSMGGLVALNLAADHAAEVDCIILAAAGIQLGNPLAPGRPLHCLQPLVSRVFKKWDLPPEYTDPSLARFDTNYHWAPMDAIVSFLEFSDLTRRRLAEVKAPTLILHSRKDTAAAPESADIIWKGISTPVEQKQLVWFERTSHEMFQDCERDAVVGAVVNYVRQRAGLTVRYSL
jgi:carboxylesterase